ncbi:MAG: SdiA-regulated domain-containing protein [Bacteroidales bacterium]|nr:SdiA-regulated domain-containing protein [Bacteroidales bacterium]
MKRGILYLSITAAITTGCLNDDIDPSYLHPVDDAEVEVFETGISNMSGLCISQDGTFLWGISDSEGLFKFDLQGNVIGQVFGGGRDFEGVAVDKATGDVYLVEETKPDGNIATNSNSLFKLNPTTNEPEFICTIAEAGKTVNKGLEGITVVGNEIWLANQEDPTDIYRYDKVQGKVVGQLSITDARFLSDIYHDPTDDVVWCTDSKKAEIFKFNLHGKRLATYAIPASFDKSEGIAIDRQNGYIWLCSDSTGRLLRIKFKFDLKIE